MPERLWSKALGEPIWGGLSAGKVLALKRPFSYAHLSCLIWQGHLNDNLKWWSPTGCQVPICLKSESSDSELWSESGKRQGFGIPARLSGQSSHLVGITCRFWSLGHFQKVQNIVIIQACNVLNNSHGCGEWWTNIGGGCFMMPHRP